MIPDPFEGWTAEQWDAAAEGWLGQSFDFSADLLGAYERVRVRGGDLPDPRSIPHATAVIPVDFARALNRRWRAQVTS